ncbi:DNA polymerase III subunit psi [Vibrio sp. SS-MA-C1-2]|uniref:DNA polymerase III subunit psi n=1 Tax=Vibrio sp. SS-MA-C1-2 TaxID=2908646 RepID=UPI001F1A968B|nr:DNA polymerase III subunit psi [Vibrio sp. SS-MA-C1-2]UJF19710.1 DNA polymerase III subunit psi [Vibrio sp. SS-MA-C1-2]
MRNFALLQEMGIPIWQLRRPELYQDRQASDESEGMLPEHCRVAFIAENKPEGHQAWLLGRIIKSMKLQPEDVFYVPLAGLNRLSVQQIEWCWFCGVEPIEHPFSDCKVLRSPSLQQLNDNPADKKQLWKKICSYND